METTNYKEKIEEELALLERELTSLGQRNPDNPNDWEASEDREMKQNDDHSDPNDNADEQEEFGERQAVLQDLKIRYNNLKKARERIKNNTYGRCEVCGKEIETERLEANLAATTCKEHIQN